MNRRHTDAIPTFRIAAPHQVGYTFDRRAPGSIDVNDATKPDDAQVLAVRAFKDGLRPGPSTGYQRLALRCEMRAQGYPIAQVTDRHKHLFEGADLPWTEGVDLELALRALTRAQASHLLRQLKGSA